jgi:hypothetical protein
MPEIESERRLNECGDLGLYRTGGRKLSEGNEVYFYGVQLSRRWNGPQHVTFVTELASHVCLKVHVPPFGVHAGYGEQIEPAHYAAAKHVLRYLAGTIGTRTHYGGHGVNAVLHGFSDSDWASCPEDRISISGYVWFYNGGPVSHSAKKQTTHVLSSTEAEYMALTATIQDGLWLKSFFGCVGIPLALPLQLFADNAGAIALSKEAANHIRTKHIDLRYHFIRRHIEEGTFEPVWLSTHKNVADIFTKSLPRPLFTHHRNGLSLISV